MTSAEPEDQAFRERLNALLVIVGIAYRASRWRAVTAMAGTAVQMLAPAVMALGMGALTDGLVAQDTRAARTGLALLAGWMLQTGLVSSFLFPLRMALRERASHQVDLELIDMTARLTGLEHFERPDYADRLQTLRDQRGLLAGAFDALTWNVGIAVGILTTVGILARLNGVLILLPLLGLPGVWITHRTAGRVERLQDRIAENIRLRQKLRAISLDAAAGAELRVFGAAEELRSRIDYLGETNERERWAVTRQSNIEAFFGQALFALGFVGAIAVLVRGAIAGSVSAGEVLIGLSLAASVRQMLLNISQMANWARQSAAAARRFAWLARCVSEAPVSPADEQRSDEAPSLIESGIAIEGVSFKYPGTDRLVLKDLTVFLPRGSTVAIVGDNGAGKSTLVKLLGCFYEPTSGQIAVDGRPLSDIPVALWRRQLSAAFQDFAKFQLLVGESVGIGELDAIEDAAHVSRALDRAAAADLLTTLPNGLETQLGREFARGVELSGGEWQKVALGRAMMREECLLLLLDEPTAALDPEAEQSLFARYSEAAREHAARTGAITLLVSHRFSTVRTANLIIVVGDGGVVETGSHDELMSANGTYAELFELQASSYR